MILFLHKHPQNPLLTILVIRFKLQFYPKKKFPSLYSNMVAPNVNGRRHLAGVHQKSPASLVRLQCPTKRNQERAVQRKEFMTNIFC